MVRQTKKEVLPKYKIVFLGETAVGKTTLITKYVFSAETQDYHPTIGVDFFAQKTEIGGRHINLQLWDTAGQERFRSLIPNYTKDSFMAVVLFDLTKKETFEKVDEWIEGFILKNNDPKIKILIVGNKKDLLEHQADKERRETSVGKEEAQQKAVKYNAEYIETCSLTADGIKDLSAAITTAIETSAVPDAPVKEFSIDAEPQRRCVCF